MSYIPPTPPSALNTQHPLYQLRLQMDKIVNALNKPLQVLTLERIDRVGRIALAIFGAICAPFHFISTFAIGAVIGLAYQMHKAVENTPAKKEVLHCCGPEEVSLTCAPGILQFLADVKPPAAVARIAAITYMAIHFPHSPLFAAFCGGPIGFYFGQKILLETLGTFQQNPPLKA